MNPLKLSNLEIIDLTIEGAGVAKNDSKVIFVDGALPGELVDVEIINEKKKFATAKISQLIKQSQYRIAPTCQHFEICGGCQLQHLNYQQQLEFKRKQVAVNLQKIAKIEDVNKTDDLKVQAIVPSPLQFGYRNKVEYSFDKRNAGFYRKDDHKKIFNITTCHLQDDLSNQIRNNLREFLNKSNHSALVKKLIIRSSTSNELMVIIIFREGKKGQQEKVLDFLQGLFPQINSLLFSIDNGKKSLIWQQDLHQHHGPDYLLEDLHGLQFKVGAKSFYQTNPQMIPLLHDKINELAKLTGQEIIYDLYCGVGSIALSLAAKAKKVIGIEIVEEAVEFARENAQLNKIDNAEFICGDLSKAMALDEEKVDLVIIDPPRKGLSPDTIQKLLDLSPLKIIYISCDPSTQARDIKELKEKYLIKEIIPFDLFPQTTHLENIVSLELL